MERSEAGLRKALERIPALREEFWRRVRVLGNGDSLNQSLEKAGRVADFLELTELMCVDALHRTESCGGHFRAESQTPDGEALRDDERFSYVAAWEYASPPVLHREELRFDHVTPSHTELQVRFTLRIWRQDDESDKGGLRDLRRGRRLAGHVVPGDAGRAQRTADRRGRGAGRVRPRLPRGHLRDVRHDDQRRRARPGEGDHDVPAAHAQLHRRRHHHHRAVAGTPVPGGQGPGGRPFGVRPDHRGGRLRQRADRQRPGRPRRAGAEGRTRTRRSTRRRASAAAPASRRARTARRCCSPRPRRPTSACCRRASPSGYDRALAMVAAHDDLGFGGCTNSGECTAVCPKGIPLETIGRLNRDVLRAATRSRR